ncbi:DUF979 domain-containing protein [Paraburkholderia bonniea]|uniref:DUF979 domain-containing protein n=1 Tax=Paraburkholderia bonniea TaxID=2152891 RepID=UPI001290F746|nr:DUF979 domain-containing protein [Paraburkholderia bonniea]WJF92063.1 DUF979 domain-containing protein [Paraburkholderia bonniea]WJF95383.1 DUF979 domain-containing protein [Paraburkholderia bonniea]
MITLEWLYLIAGLMFAAFALFNLADRSRSRRGASFLFWGIYAATFLFGGVLPHFVTGCMALALALIAGSGQLSRKALASNAAPESGEQQACANARLTHRENQARRFGSRLFIPALLIPLVTLAGTFTLKYLPFIQTKNVTLISLVLGTLVAFAVALVMLRDSPIQALKEARQTMDSVGWAAILPQMLAALGALFAVAGVGGVVSDLVQAWVPLSSSFAVIAAYGLGMALFTMVMGNAFAAFPVMTAGIGLPLIVQQFGGNPAIMGAIGMLCGFCGTLMTPMAANFNIVPAALLELRDKNGVIKAQVPTALLLLAVNVLLMYFLVFRF